MFIRKEVGSEKTISGAKSGLESISNVFLTTISKYRSHAEKSRQDAEVWVDKSESFRQKELEASQTSRELKAVADQADTLAEKLENLFK